MTNEEQRLHWDQKYQEEMASLTKSDPFFLSAYKEFVEDSFPNAGVALHLRHKPFRLSILYDVGMITSSRWDQQELRLRHVRPIAAARST
jgi:hypothetical protein